MIKKLLFTLSLCMLAGSILYAQSTIRGEIKDSKGSPIPYLQVLLKQEGRVVNGAYTDDLGVYQIFGISAGTYDITAGGSGNCMTVHTEKGIYVSSSEVKFVNLVIDCSSTELREVEVTYVPPLFNADNTKSSERLTGEEVRKTPGRSITGALANLGGVAGVDGSMQSVRGNREDGQQTIIDGVRVRGSNTVAQRSVEGAELIQGGIPAEYGDGTSFMVITTSGVARDFRGEVELGSSLEGYGQMIAAVNLSGPILKGKTPQDPARMGFMLSAEGNYNIDGRPLQGGSWMVKPDVRADIIKTPVKYEPEGDNYVPYYRASELGSDAFQKTRVRQNSSDWNFLIQGKIDIMGGGKDARGRPKNNLRFSVTGSYEHAESQRRDWWYTQALFNSENTRVFSNNTLRLSARINHRVKTDTAANAILKNIMYDVNVSYTLYNGTIQDKNHKNNFFTYGYVGKFSTERTDLYANQSMLVYNPEIGRDTVMEFTRLELYQAANWTKFDQSGYLNNGTPYNQDLVYYTQNFIDFIQLRTGVDINNATEEERMIVWQFLRSNITNDVYQGYFALLNGDSPNLIANNLFSAPGAIRNGYQKMRDEAIGARASLTLNIKNHDVKFGFEFEKLTRRSYSINPLNLWDLMRSSTTNASNFEFDFANAYWAQGGNSPYFEDGRIVDTLMYPINPNLSNFDKNLRELIDKKYPEYRVGDLEFLDIDSYDPSIFSLDLFSNFELFRAGNNIVSYYGYDYTGQKSKNKINLHNFFSGGDMHEAGKYAIGAFEPVYMALYIQDKFAISNLLFNVGLRLDYFNAMQPVLKDPFLFREAYTVRELRSNGWTIPIDNAGDDWIPYVQIADQDINNAPKTIVAYRNDKIWYNSYGQEVTDPTSALGTGGPVLQRSLDPEAPSKVESKAFEEYKPEVNIMPRLSFSFPVSTNSLFYAHYNIITYRPEMAYAQINPISYLFIANPNHHSDRNPVNNPKLRSQRSVDYEIGFRQKVGENASLSIAAYYSEKKDLIQSYRFTGAYPNTYYSYENQDFGTVQGFTLGLAMRGAKNLTFRANYTLQFAKGTGSSAESNIAIIASGQPNLRTLTNLEFDQRHSISGTIILNFNQGTNYNGPVSIRQKKGTDTKQEIRWLENVGIVLNASARSGMPYSRSGIVYSALGWGERTKGQLQGAINGANMPWTFTCDMRVEKSFMLNLASKKDKTESSARKTKPGMLNVYLDFLNLFNIKNVLNVYDYTGNPNDDGYLSSSLFQSQNAKETVFGMPMGSATNYYEMGIANPFNFTQPFRVQLGVIFAF